MIHNCHGNFSTSNAQFEAARQKAGRKKWAGKNEASEQVATLRPRVPKRKPDRSPTAGSSQYRRQHQYCDLATCGRRRETDDKIAFAGWRNDRWNVYGVSRRTKAQKQRTNFTKPNTYVRYPVWSPLSNQIIYEFGETTGNVWLLELK